MLAMELTPKLIEEAEFRETRKGYDRDQVDDFLEEAAASVAKLLSQLAETRQRAEAAEARLAAAAADGDSATAASAGPAGPDPKALEANTDELKRTLVLGQRTADAAIREARAEAARLQAEAKDKSSRQVAEAETRARQTVIDADREAEQLRTEAQSRLLSEVQALEGIREELRSDADLIDRYVGEQREQLRGGLQELQRLLDDPKGFRLAPAPPHRDVRLPDFVETSAAPPTDAWPAPEAAPVADPGEQGADSAAGAPDVRNSPPVGAVSLPRQKPGDQVAARSSPVLDLTRPAEGGPPTDAGPEPAPATAPTDDGPAARAAGPTADDGPSTQAAPPSRDDSAPTQAVPQLVGDADEDAFLAELRKAMTDSEPLGPRDTVDSGAPPAVPRRAPDDSARPRPRFGRRR